MERCLERGSNSLLPAAFVETGIRGLGAACLLGLSVMCPIEPNLVKLSQSMAVIILLKGKLQLTYHGFLSKEICYAAPDHAMVRK